MDLSLLRRRYNTTSAAAAETPVAIAAPMNGNDELDEENDERTMKSQKLSEHS